MSVVAIHGASKGIGFALLKQILLHSGHSVVATARSEATFQSSLSTIPNLSAQDRVLFVPMDNTKEDSIHAASKAVQDRFGQSAIAAVINVAGYLNPEKSVRQFNESEIYKHFAVNTIGPMLISKHWHSLMMNGKLSGKSKPITSPAPFRHPLWINISARTGSIGDNRLGGWYSYRMSKAALNQLTRCLSVELGHKGICVTSLHPGTVDSDLSRKFISKSSTNKIFTADEAAENLFRVLTNLEFEKHNGAFLDYKHDPIVW